MSDKKPFDPVAYKNDFTAKNYDRISLVVPKGQKDLLKAHAEKHGESVNGFIQRAISEAMERDNSKE